MAPILYDVKPKPGDLIEIFRGIHQHWAVYVGDGFVVHLAPPSKYAGAGFSSMRLGVGIRALVKKEHLWDVVEIDRWRINNSLDHKYKTRPTRLIVREACELVGRELRYSVFSLNCEHFVNELRYGKAESPQYDVKPEPGDLIEIFRGLYQHWAVYVGDGFVVHLAPPTEYAGAGSSSMMSLVGIKALVKKEQLWDVVGTDRWKINNSLDHKYEPRPTRVIVREACELVGRELPYSVILLNCEHLVNELRYGKAESLQVQTMVKIALVVPLWPLLIILALTENTPYSRKTRTSSA